MFNSKRFIHISLTRILFGVLAFGGVGNVAADYNCNALGQGILHNRSSRYLRIFYDYPSNVFRDNWIAPGQSSNLMGPEFCDIDDVSYTLSNFLVWTYGNPQPAVYGPGGRYHIGWGTLSCYDNPSGSYGAQISCRTY
jgi:hypothetical protein